MQLYVLPISGGYFPHQLAVLEWLSNSSTKPDIALGSSGGNVSSYVSMAGNWDPLVIRKKIISRMSSKIFIKSWWPSYLFYLPSMLKGYFKGSMYNINPDFFKFFKSIYNPSNIKITELWSGTFQQDCSMTQLFCNLSNQEAQVKHSEKSNGELLNYLPFIYCDGDISNLSKVCFASASIPVVLPSVKINDNNYTDGGNSFASPLTPMKESLQATIGNQKLDLTYITPYNIQSAGTQFCHTVVDSGNVDGMNLGSTYTQSNYGSMYSQGKYALNALLKSLYLQDRMSGLELVQSGYQDKTTLYEEKIVSFDEFKAIEERRKSYQRTLLEVYPLMDSHISIVKFGPNDILDIMDQTSQVGIRFWYI